MADAISDRDRLAILADHLARLAEDADVALAGHVPPKRVADEMIKGLRYAVAFAREGQGPERP